MAEFLEGYGVADARRARIFWRAIIGAAVILALSLTGYFLFRTWPAKRKVNQFVELLRKTDYQGAYRLWGCTAPDSPCRDYTLEKFLEDWGPKSAQADASRLSFVRASYCGPGVIVTLKAAKGPDLALWYERKDGNIGFAPWPVCAPQPKAFQ